MSSFLGFLLRPDSTSGRIFFFMSKRNDPRGRFSQDGTPDPTAKSDEAERIREAKEKLSKTASRGRLSDPRKTDTLPTRPVKPE